MKLKNKLLYLDIGLRMLGVIIDRRTQLKIIFLIELIQRKKGKTTMHDVVKINKKIQNPSA